jgi:hypothetical protein
LKADRGSQWRTETQPFSQSGAALLELSRPECGTMVGTIVPPDVRFAVSLRDESSALGVQCLSLLKDVDREALM